MRKAIAVMKITSIFAERKLITKQIIRKCQKLQL